MNMKIIFTDEQLNQMHKRADGRLETCVAQAEEAMKKAKIDFDDIERINDHYETHTWGSNADRRYRKSAINKAIKKVAYDPAKYAVV